MSVVSFIFFDVLKANFFNLDFYIYILISYVVRIPCISSIFILSTSFISLIVETFASNLKGRDFMTLCTIIDSLIFSPSPMIVLKTHRHEGRMLQYFLHHRLQTLKLSSMSLKVFPFYFFISFIAILKFVPNIFCTLNMHYLDKL